ncbi:DinB family protein [Pontibacter sp. G13]|uniref:DinB family protein n=1 Tax=Pontibacter sp. G13 TaxID=3074898 RepID=UPI002889C395|nr:DinB family protein [Pontibacter sp. G13]WNJ18211.1 hypothetical protein RJD25_25450 [Pontibacter sp. G13]
MTRPIILGMLLFVGFALNAHAQQSGETPMPATTTELPFKQINTLPSESSEGHLLGRMVDALGFRFYWASEGLTEADLDYRPTDAARSSRETLEHMLGLSEVIRNAATHQPNIRPANQPEMTFEEIRAQTLLNLKEASDAFHAAEESATSFDIEFERGGNTTTFPVWNLINGPIADAIYHTGQIVSFRRTSGNPIRPGVNVFMGTVKE